MPNVKGKGYSARDLRDVSDSPELTGKISRFYALLVRLRGLWSVTCNQFGDVHGHGEKI